RRRGPARPLRRRGRRLELAVRPRPRHRARPGLPAGHGDPDVLREPVARRPVDRVVPRPARPRGQLTAGLRLGVPGGRRHDQRGHGAAVNGEGIDYAYETGRLAADVLDEALTTRSGLALQRYESTLEAEFGLYFKVARLFAHVIGRPVLMRELTRVGMRSRSLMEWVLRIM